MEDQSTEDMIRQILEDQKGVIKSNLKDQLQKHLTDSLSWSLREKIGVLTDEFIKKEMSEDIKAALLEAKPEILVSLKTAFIKIGGAVSVAMYEQAAKNLVAHSYKTSEIIKKILD